MGAGAGDRPDVPQHGGDEGQLRGRAAHAVRHGAPSGVLAGGDRAPAAADAVRPAGQPRRSRTTSPTRCSIGWSTASIPTACRTPARRNRSPAITRDDLVAFHRQVFRPEQRHPRHRRRRDGGGSVRRRSRRCSATGRGSDVPAETFIEPPAPTRRADRGQQARRGADRSARRPHRASSASIPITWRVNLAIRILGGEGSNRLHQVLRTAARPDLRRAGQHGRAARRAAISWPQTNTRSDATGRGAAAHRSTSSGGCSASRSASASWPTPRRT